MSNSKVEVTFKVPKDRTVTLHRERMKDGQKAEVTPQQKEWLAQRGLITASPSKPESKG